MSKILTVFGASGNQGSSVIHTVLQDASLSQEYRIRAITRDANKPSLKQLTEKGVEIVVADASSPSSLSNAVEDAHTVFLMTNFWESKSADVEIAQGKAVADACKSAGVQHLIFSSLLNTAEASKGRLLHITHFDGKAQIEEYIRSIDVPATFVLPGMFMAGYFDLIRKNEDGSFALALPISEDKPRIPLFDAASDTGKFVTAAIKAFPTGQGKRIYAATNYYTPKQIVSEFSGVIHEPTSFVQLPEEVFKSFLPPPIAQELTENMLLLEDPGYYAGADLSESLGILSEKPTTWKEFVEANKAKWLD